MLWPGCNTLSITLYGSQILNNCVSPNMHPSTWGWCITNLVSCILNQPAFRITWLFELRKPSMFKHPMSLQWNEMFNCSHILVLSHLDFQLYLQQSKSMCMTTIDYKNQQERPNQIHKKLHKVCSFCLCVLPNQVSWWHCGMTEIDILGCFSLSVIASFLCFATGWLLLMLVFTTCGWFNGFCLIGANGIGHLIVCGLLWDSLGHTRPCWVCSITEIRGDIGGITGRSLVLSGIALGLAGHSVVNNWGK